VPDEITVELWKEAIDAAVEAHKFKPDIDTLVLDGIPRKYQSGKNHGGHDRRPKSLPSRLPESRNAVRAPEKSAP
jgi:hypothetical protein